MHEPADVRRNTKDAETARVRSIWADFAPKYDRQIAWWERILFGGGRQWACSQARGDVLEIGVGTGRNLPFYSLDLRLTGIDLSPHTLAFAKVRGRELGRDIALVEGDAQSLPFEDERFDTVVSTLTMCSIPDYRAAVTEVHRVLRPGGRFVLVEHVRSPNPVVRGGQRILNPLSVRFAADHLVREPLHGVQDAGFEVEGLQRLKAGIVERLTARKPGGGS
ncbi:MAG TPA: class I SAM-dependent methyltransferase [Actinomycetota bacterium]|nr:class I SAM-dependent methyltransferase [Actinomycetota bacterium]